MAEYHDKRAKEILKSIPYATLATVTPDGEPWNSPVKHEIDDSLNIYWVSDQANQHSKNIARLNKVYIVIYDSTVPEGQGEGVYIKAEVEIVANPNEILRIRRLKKGNDYAGSPDELLGDDNRRMYKAVPQAAWMNDAEVGDGQFIRDYKVEVNLEELKKIFHETL